MTTTKKAILIIAFNGFQDTEYSVTKSVLEQAGISTITASSSLGTATGKFGLKVEVENLISDVNPNDYEAVVLIGGPGAEEYLNNKTIQQLIIQANQQNKVLAAICLAPAILAQTGVLSGKQATVWSSAADKSLIDILTSHGAKYVDQGVVVDGRIITANGPDAAQQFAAAIINQLK